MVKYTVFFVFNIKMTKNDTGLHKKDCYSYYLSSCLTVWFSVVGLFASQLCCLCFALNLERYLISNCIIIKRAYDYFQCCLQDNASF